MENLTKIESDFVNLYQLLGLTEESMEKVITIKRSMMDSAFLKALDLPDDSIESYVMSRTHNAFVDRMIALFEQTKMKVY